MNVIERTVGTMNKWTGTTPRLGFAVMVGEDGVIPEDVLIELKAAGYHGIEPNCYQVQHLHEIVEFCRKVGLAIHAIPTGRWMNVAEARQDYDRYTEQALVVLSEGAAIAAAIAAPLILGLVRGTGSTPDADAEHFLSSVISHLEQRTPQLRILVEPIATDEAAWPHTIEQGAALVRRLNRPTVKLLADSYHIARSGEDPNLDRYSNSIGHLHIRDSQRQIPAATSPEYESVYASILRLWREHNLVLSFEPAVDLTHTVQSGLAGADWIKRATAPS